MLRTIKKLNKKGFSVVEIVIAVVVVVAVAGLGLYSFNNRTKTTSTSTSSDAAEASAATYTTLPAPSGRLVKAQICKRSAGRFDVTFATTNNYRFYNNKSPHTPSIGNYSKKTGGSSNARYNGTRVWWRGNTQYHKNVHIDGNDKSYLSVAYHDKAGVRVSRSSINYCK